MASITSSKLNIMNNPQIIPRYPLNGHSSYLIDKFYIFGYDSITLKKYFNDDENIKNIISDKKQYDDSKFQRFQMKELPVLLNEFSSDYEKECLEIDMIREMILPKNVNFYYLEEERWFFRSPEKRRKKENNKNFQSQAFEKREDIFEIYDDGGFNKIETPKSYNVIFSSNPQSGNNSKKSINGFAYIFYRKLKDDRTDMNISFYIPTIFSIISEYPFYNSFYELCKQIEFLYSSNEIRIPLEIIIYNLINLSPSPLNGDVILSLKSITNLETKGKTNFKSFVNDIIEEEEDNEENYDENTSQTLIDKLTRRLTRKDDNKKEQPKSSSFQGSSNTKNLEKNNRTKLARKTAILQRDILKLVTDSSNLRTSILKHVKTISSTPNKNNFNIAKITSVDPLKKIKFNFLTGYPVIQYNLAKVLLQTLTPIDVIDIFLYTFLEKDVLFFSKDLEFLSLTINSYLNLNFPLNDEKYYFINACVSYDNYINGNSTFVGSTFTTIIGINDQYNQKYQNESQNKLKEHIAIDLDNGRVYKVEDKNDKEKSKKNKELFNYIKYICKNRDNKNEVKILFREINILNKVLTDIYSKMNDKEDEINYNIFKNNKYIDYSDDNIKDLNLKIQDSFYRFINNISLYIYENLLVNTDTEKKMKLKNSNIQNEEDELNVIFLEQYKDDDIYSKEEQNLLEELQETMKFQSFVYSFVQSYNPIDLYKIPLTFTEEFISIISRKSCILEGDINFLSLINDLYKKNSEGEVNIDFEPFLIEYYSNYEHYFEREIQDIFEENKFHPDKIRIRNYNIDNKIIIKYKSYELDDKILIKYLYLLNELEQNDNYDNKDINNSIFLLMKKRIKENIPKNISITDIESLIENYAIEKGILSESDLCSANIIILFTLSFRSIKAIDECQSFLSILFQDFTIFRKYYSMIMSMIYTTYEESLEKKDYKRAKDCYYLYYLCINSLMNVKVIPNESLTNIIKKFNKKKYDDKKIEQNIQNETIKKEYDINKGIKLYGRDLPEDDITCKNLYITHNFSSTKFFKEKEILEKINDPKENSKFFISVDGAQSLQPKIKFNNGVNSFNSFFYSQKLLLLNLVEEYQNYIVDMNENNLRPNIILDACLNTFIFMRNSKEFTDKSDIYLMVKVIFYIFLNHFLILNKN